MEPRDAEGYYADLGSEPKDLREQAQELRQVSRIVIRGRGQTQAPLWMKLAALVFFAVLLGAIAFILISGTARRQMVAEAAAAWLRVSGAEQARVHPLPPPPRQAAIREVRGSRAPLVAASGGARITASALIDEAEDQEPRGILHYNLKLPTSGDGRWAPPPSPDAVAPTAKTPASEAAFEFLKAQSKAVGQLVSNSVGGYTYQGWQPVVNEPPRFFIGLEVTDSQGLATSLIWEVNMERQEVRARSQLARELSNRLEQ